MGAISDVLAGVEGAITPGAEPAILGYEAAEHLLGGGGKKKPVDKTKDKPKKKDAKEGDQ